MAVDGDNASGRVIFCHLVFWRSDMATDSAKGPASYFPSIETKYGHPIEYWKDLVRGQRGKKHMELVTWLKQEHGMGHGHANALVADTLRE